MMDSLQWNALITATQENYKLKDRVRELEAFVQKTVDLYGKPGGPWNVPSEPGSWLSEARRLLEGK